MNLDGRVIYQLDPATFFDADGDGVGDFEGVSRKLDHVRAVGADTVWLQPFYVSPYLDAGYDVVDHRDVSARFGTMAEFEQLVERCHQLDLRVMVELVAQHTSIHHPWFRAARNDPDSPYRDYYVWAPEPRDDPAVPEPVFPGAEESVWAYDDHAGKYYRHAFYRHEADLDVGHPEVREEIRKTIRHWLDRGVDGFRVDAVPYMVRQAALTDDRDDGYWFLTELAAAADGAPLMGEVDAPPDQYDDYFGDADRLHAILDFWTNNLLFLALARREAEPLIRALREQPEPPDGCTYVNWLRNHDELDLERLSENERDEVMTEFAPAAEMRAFGRGIRRRLAPMLGDARRTAMAHAIVESLPGAPVVRYGEEIGMGEDLSLPDRMSVRTPMQWSPELNGGFSKAPPGVVGPGPIQAGPFAFSRVNVEDQELRSDSLLSRVSQLVRTRRQLGELPSHRSEPVAFEHPAVFGVLHHRADDSILMLANLSADEVHLGLPYDVRADLLADSEYNPATNDSLRLAGHGYRWLRVHDHTR
ncbi:alpha-amylase family protein [Kribbella shirazensis]|uniref:Maltose alpha-D-glucosyltransferase/alpha-amylase n=1 Tax=Kribbella shirazensis TaxID=1105143 RepID=A0A7X5VD14_9ACTN|nr:alpha-amylase family protein [Kribbella shirazensis]NIK58991.1 maltose alpha-D-glucosyltransferase/alpha-amylase [Kribbella shirazensis]